MAVTYNLISTNTLTASASSYTFSSVPQTYTDLVFVLHGKITTGNAYPFLRFNSDTGANYATIAFGATSATTQAIYNSVSGELYLSNFISGMRSADSSYMVQADIMSYRNSSHIKYVLSHAGNSQGTEKARGIWNSTTAISTIYVGLQSGSFDVGTTFSLYGILRA